MRCSMLGENRIEEGIHREKKLGMKELKLLSATRGKGRGRNVKRVLTRLEALGTGGDQKNNTSKTSHMPEDR